MMLNLDEIRAVTEAATPGPWKAVDKGNTVPFHAVFAPSIDGSKPVNICSGISPKTGNANFIASARQWVPVLCDEVEAGREKIKELESCLAESDCLVADHADELHAANKQIAVFKRALEISGQYVAAHAGELRTETWPEHFIRMAKRAREEMEK